MKRKIDKSFILGIILISLAMTSSIFSNLYYIRENRALTVSKIELNEKLKGSKTQVTCHQNDKYLIVEPIQNMPGNFIIKNKKYQDDKIECAYNSSSNDYEIDNMGGMGSVIGLKDNFLFLDYGSSKIRLLDIYDLEKRENIFSDGYRGGFKIIEQDKDILFTYWRFIPDTELKATPKNCPEFNQYFSNGFGSGFKEFITFNLSKMTKEIGKRTCVALE